jgi:hypothetical protein
LQQQQQQQHLKELDDGGLSPDLGLERNLERRQLMTVMGELATNPIPVAPMFGIPVLLCETLIDFRNEEAREG